MGQPTFLAVGLLAVVTGTGQAAERVMDLRGLAASLDLTERGVRTWLERLGVGAGGLAPERLLAVDPAGELLMVRQGQGSSVRVDPELDNLLLTQGTEIILIHNHPANVGLSADDLRQLTKPGVLAIVAIGHEGSVFVAAAGPRLDRLFFADRQYALARAEITRRLRAEWPSGRVSVAHSDAHFSHLVTSALAKAGVVRYWFQLRGPSRYSYERARFVFGQLVAGAAARVR